MHGHFGNWIFERYLWSRYLFCCSYTHNVAAKGKYIAFVTTEAETDNPEVELKPGVDLLGPVDEIFYDSYDRYEPTNDPTADSCFISAVSHLLTVLAICLTSCYYAQILIFRKTFGIHYWNHVDSALPAFNLELNHPNPSIALLKKLYVNLLQCCAIVSLLQNVMFPCIPLSHQLKQSQYWAIFVGFLSQWTKALWNFRSFVVK